MRGSAMKLRLLCDNNTFIDQYLLGEPAFSCYIEIDGARILLDTGYSDVFARNAETLGIDLTNLTHVVLSHGHDDHTRGLVHLPRPTEAAQLIAHPRCLLKRWLDDLYIGPPKDGAVPEGFDYRPSTAPVRLTEHCVFLGEIPVTHDFEPRYSIGEVLVNGQREPDFLTDDSALVCQTERGLFIITGCSHSGICNIVSYAQQVCGETRIAGILGGFHLLEASERTEQTAAFLKALQPEALYPCHCVSLAAKLMLARTLDIREAGSGLYLEL